MACKHTRQPVNQLRFNLAVAIGLGQGETPLRDLPFTDQMLKVNGILVY